MITADIICKVLDELVEPITPTGEMARDALARYNLNVLSGISNWCINKLVKASEYRRNPEQSMRSIGLHAMDELNYIKSQIEEIEENE